MSIKTYALTPDGGRIKGVQVNFRYIDDKVQTFNCDIKKFKNKFIEEKDLNIIRISFSHECDMSSYYELINKIQSECKNTKIIIMVGDGCKTFDPDKLTKPIIVAKDTSSSVLYYLKNNWGKVGIGLGVISLAVVGLLLYKFAR